MAKERRDSKNRLLNRGEYQKEDGRYMYRYTDINGVSRYVYSWTLTKSDRVPHGKQAGPCLRDLEKQIAKDLHDEIDSFNAKNCTLNDYFEKYISQKKAIKDNTRSQYRKTYNLYLRDRIGDRKISTFKYSDIKKCYNDILIEYDISISSMNNVNTVLKPVFNMAVRDALIRSNPVEGVLAEITKEMKSESGKRVALTPAQQHAFVDFLSKSRVYMKWKTLFTVMLGTGCRIGEICGLTWDDCDFSGNMIHVRRTIYYTPDEFTGKYSLRAHSPKSHSGYRSIPMLTDVREALWQERIRQMKEGFCTDIVDGVSGFVFHNNNGKARIPDNVNTTIHRLVAKYNAEERVSAKESGREPLLIPDFSSHVLRHTFCTRLCENNMDVKVLQQVMGHAKVTTTLDVYTSVTADYKTTTFQSIDGKLKIV